MPVLFITILHIMFIRNSHACPLFYIFLHVTVSHLILHILPSSAFLFVFLREAILMIMIIKIKLRSFESSEHINEERDGPYRGFGFGKMEQK